MVKNISPELTFANQDLKNTRRSAIRYAALHCYLELLKQRTDEATKVPNTESCARIRKLIPWSTYLDSGTDISSELIFIYIYILIPILYYSNIYIYIYLAQN